MSVVTVAWIPTSHDYRCWMKLHIVFYFILRTYPRSFQTPLRLYHFVGIISGPPPVHVHLGWVFCRLPYESRVSPLTSGVTFSAQVLWRVLRKPLFWYETRVIEYERSHPPLTPLRMGRSTTVFGFGFGCKSESSLFDSKDPSQQRRNCRGVSNFCGDLRTIIGRH